MAEDSLDSDYDSDRVAEVEKNRERFLEFSRVTLGIAPNEAYEKKLKAYKAKKKQAKKSSGVTEEVIQYGGLAFTAGLNCPCHEGCRADHGGIYIAQTISKRHDRLDRVEVKEDTGSGPSWISHAVARTLGLPIYALKEPLEYKGFEGEVFSVTHCVSMTLVGQSEKSCHDDFWIASDGSSVKGVLVGRHFIEKYGHPFSLFDRKQGNEVNLVVQNKKSQTEVVAIAERRVENESKAKEVNERRRRQRHADPRKVAGGKPRKSLSVASGSTVVDG